jgi:hypothetical protein
VRYGVVHEAFQRSYRGGEVMENWIPDTGWGFADVPDYTHAIEDVNQWLPNAHRTLLLEFLVAQSRQHKRFKITASKAKLLKKNPYAWIYSYVWDDDDRKWIEQPEVDAWLDDQWARFLGAFYSARVKRDGMVMAWKRGDAEAMRAALGPEAERGIDKAMFAESEDDEPARVEVHAFKESWEV